MKKRSVVIWSIILVFIMPLIIGLFIFLYALLLDFMAYHYEDSLPDKSLNYLLRLHNLAPDNAYTNHRLAIHYYLEGDYLSAANFFERELSDEERFESNILLCNCDFHLDLKELFLTCSERLVKKYPEKGESHFLLGLAYFKQDKLFLSRNEFFKSYSISRDCDALAFIIGISEEMDDKSNIEKYCNFRACNKVDNIIETTIEVDDICSISR